MLCPHCGRRIEGDSRFCKFCGTPVSAGRPERRAGLPTYLWVLLPLVLAALVVLGLVTSRWLQRRPSSQVAVKTTGLAATPAVVATYTLSPSLTVGLTRTLASAPTLLPTSTAQPAPTEAAYAPPSTETSAPTITATPVPQPTATPTALPPCPLTTTVAVDPALSPLSQGAVLGCPLEAAQVVWAAWQPFQHGYMLWRSDTSAITVFFTDQNTQLTLPDEWAGEEFDTAKPPEGMLAPKRGFGWIWTQNQEIADRLGWATQQEKGICIRVQILQAGFVFRSATEPCGSELNRAGTGGFKPIFFEALDSGPWVQH